MINHHIDLYFHVTLNLKANYRVANIRNGVCNEAFFWSLGFEDHEEILFS
jgi:hypothetical protein